jgi:hypothetical protein
MQENVNEGNEQPPAEAMVQDNREYQDFLKMFTGKAKTRETGMDLSYITVILIVQSCTISSTCKT